MTDGPIIPQLQVAHVDAARQLLLDVFGFAVDGPYLRQGTQRIAVVQATGGSSLMHGVIDHLAIAVPDVALAMAGFLARGAQPDTSVTPDGPQEIAEFWQGGVRYFFFRGPGDVRIELCANLANPATAIGHDHIGIPCTDIATSAAFFAAQGASLLSSVDLMRPDGMTQVRFLDLRGSVLELYTPPSLRGAAEHSAPAQGLWQRLLVEGLKTEIVGPDGILLSPAKG